MLEILQVCAFISVFLSLSLCYTFHTAFWDDIALYLLCNFTYQIANLSFILKRCFIYNSALWGENFNWLSEYIIKNFTLERKLFLAMCIYVNFTLILWKWVFLDLKRMIFDIHALLKFPVYEHLKVSWGKLWISCLI